MESKISNSEIIKNKPGDLIIPLQHRNTFILSIINKLGNYFDKKFIKYNNYFFDDEYDKLECLFDYFSLCCEKNNKIEKKLAINLIFNILVKINIIDDHFENLIHILVEEIISDNSFKNENEFLNKVINSDLKFCINQEKYYFIINYMKIHVININLLLNLLIFFFKENNEKDIIRLICSDLKAKYPKLIISDSNIDSIDIKKEDYLICLNKLINLDYKSIVDEKILEFEDSEFKLRMISSNKSDSYISEEPHPGKISPYSSNEKENNYETNYNEISNDTSNYEFDINSLNPFQKFLLNEVKKNSQKSKEALKLANEAREKSKKALKLSNEVMEKLKKVSEESIYRNYELQKLNHSINKLKKKVRGLQIDMKIIKTGSLYKFNIDIFENLFGFNLLDSYYVKIEKIIESLGSFPKSDKVSELKKFLSNILSYIYERKDLSHLINDRKLPLDLAFSVLEEDCNLHFKYLKNIFADLSLNYTLKYAHKYYLNQDDEEKFLKNIQFSIKDLEEKLK